MKLKLLEAEDTLRVPPRDVLDYEVFRNRYRGKGDANELQVFEKFYAARSLITDGLDTYLDARISGEDDSPLMKVDTCGIRDDLLIAVFCETAPPTISLWQSIEKIYNSQNARAVILAPYSLDPASIEELMPGALETGKVTLESLGWFDDQLENTFQQTLRLIDLLGNETRMRMLAPLFQKAAAKKEFRTTINPKLVYQNLSNLLEAGLVDEMAGGTYELSQLGRTILAEFITFLEKTRKTLGIVGRDKEVSLNG